jgi:hypothetical protein
MAFVQKAVARLHEPEKLETLLQELGKKHYTYGAKQKYIDVSSQHCGADCVQTPLSNASIESPVYVFPTPVVNF